MRSSRITAVYVWLGRAQGFCVTMGAFVAVALKADPSRVATTFGPVGPFLAASLVTIQNNAWILTPGFLLLSTLIGWARRRYGDPEIWRHLQMVVDEMREAVFGPIKGDYQHHYRVTLYRYRRWVWTRSVRRTWLVPVLRSGHTSQNGIRTFSINPRRPGEGQGIAGRAWESEGAIHVPGLPDIRNCTDRAKLDEYAQETNLPVKLLNTKGTCSRSFWAVRVEAKGEPWGVLVLDSVSPTMSKKKALQFFRSRAQFLSLLLQRA